MKQASEFSFKFQGGTAQPWLGQCWEEKECWCMLLRPGFWQPLGFCSLPRQFPSLGRGLQVTWRHQRTAGNYVIMALLCRLGVL